MLKGEVKVILACFGIKNIGPRPLGVAPPLDPLVPLKLQMVGAGKKHDLIIQQDSARPYTTNVKQHFLVENIINVLD